MSMRLWGGPFFFLGGEGRHIVLAAAMLAGSDFLWTFELRDLVHRVLYIPGGRQLPLWASFAGTIVLLGIALWIIRTTTKNVRIKLK